MAGDGRKKEDYEKSLEEKWKRRNANGRKNELVDYEGRRLSISTGNKSSSSSSPSLLSVSDHRHRHHHHHHHHNHH
ncbi:unnamed protein product [Litomosoides sigmodontis]|uniref:Uncharacterized protein n=1 Tax=Litomosoides sigmodontis TaxID=42156 RepID=A0A3P6UTW0_LITSI|nr:unnamed protein product [Litomosoides sigmodontis]